MERKSESDRKGNVISLEVRERMIRDAQKETAHYKTQFENAMPLVENQKLSIKMLQDELGEEAEFDAEETRKCVVCAVNARLGSTDMRID
jgi:hypothetical protein